MIRSLDRGAITTLMEDLLERPPADMRAALSQWAAEQDVAIA
jgi:phosphotransferase system enzyme I (PtsP)